MLSYLTWSEVWHQQPEDSDAAEIARCNLVQMFGLRDSTACRRAQSYRLEQRQKCQKLDRARFFHRLTFQVPSAAGLAAR
jgi:hypothetical protein